MENRERERDTQELLF